MYKLKSGEIITDPMYIMPDEWVSDRVVEKIRSRYGLNEELKLIRLGAMDSRNADFIEYALYVETCREWGKMEKKMYQERRDNVDVILD
jgi:hypothetical protein